MLFFHTHTLSWQQKAFAFCCQVHVPDSVDWLKIDDWRLTENLSATFIYIFVILSVIHLSSIIIKFVLYTFFLIKIFDNISHCFYFCVHSALLSNFPLQTLQYLHIFGNFAVLKKLREAKFTTLFNWILKCAA